MAKRSHPNDIIEAMPAERRATFFPETIDEDYFGEWMRWLALLFGIEIGEDRIAAMYRAMSAHNLTNAELGIAGSWIEEHSERFPVVSTFIRCPALGRNFSKSS